MACAQALGTLRERLQTSRCSVSAAGGKLLVSEVLDDRLAVYKLDLADKADKELMFAHPQVDIGGAIEWPGTNRVVGFWYETDRYQRAIFDAEAAAIFEVVDKSLPGTTNYIVDPRATANCCWSRPIRMCCRASTIFSISKERRCAS